jgi:hypothetical protein
MEADIDRATRRVPAGRALPGPGLRSPRSSRLLVSIAAMLAAGVPAERAWAFYGYGAANYALAYALSDPPFYKHYGSDCTNFVSTCWNRGGGVPMSIYWHEANYGWNGYFFYEGSYSFIRVRDFRSYWFIHGSRYVHVEGSAALGSAYSPALLGDAYVFDSGDSAAGPDWVHASIEVRWTNGFDEYAQHSDGKVVDWRRWYRTRTPWQRSNMTRAGHGIRIISPP